jgi:Cu/Ag efflux pump CusA
VSILPNVLTTPPAMRQPISSTNRVMAIGLTSARLSPIELSVLARWTVRPRLLGLPGVANVAIWGLRDRQLQVRVDPRRLHRSGVTLNQVISTVGNAQLVSPLSFLNASSPGTGGFVDGPNQRLTIRHVLPFGAPRKLAQVPVDGTGGRRLQVGDVARVVNGHPPLIGDAVVHGGRGLMLVIEKLPGASTAAVTRSVQGALNELRPGLPGVHVDASIFRPATYVDSARHNVALMVIIGSLLMLLVAAAFLLRWRAVLISAVAVLASMLAAVSLLYLTGATINAMVAAGLLIALAVVVDDAVGDSHNIARRIEEQRRRGEEVTAKVVVRGALEMRSSLGYATLIVLLAVAPVFVAQGVSASFVRPMALAYVFAVLASMVVALTVTPALSMLLASKGPPAPLARRLRQRLAGAYAGLLARTIRMPRAALLAACAAGLIGLAAVPWLREPGPPSFKDRNILVQWHAAAGTSLPEMDRITTRTARELQALPGIKDVGADIGRAVTGDQVVGTNSAELWITMKPDADYDRTLGEISTVAHGTPGVDGDVRTYESDRSSRVLARPPRTIAVRLYGQSFTTLGQKAGEVERLMSHVAGVRDPVAELPTTQPTMEVEVKLGAALRHGLKPGDVRRAAGTLLNGLTVGDFFEQQKVFEVVVQGDPQSRPTVASVRNISIDTPGGGQVPLGSVASVRIHADPTDIRHDSVSRFVDVRATVQGRSPDAVRSDVQRQLKKVSFPLEYHAEVTGGPASHTTHTRFVSFVVAAALGILLLLQAAFRSWRLAFLLLTMLPLAVAGGVIVALAAGSQHSLGAYAGLLAIFCIAARQGLMLISRIERIAEEEGLERGPVVAQRGARERLLPTVTSAATTMAALLPFVILGDRPGNEITDEMAAVILGGMVTSTLLILFVLPAAYSHLVSGRSRVRSEQHAALPLVSVALVAVLLLSGCADSETPKEGPAAKVERSGGTTRVVLSSNAARRLGVQTAPVRRAGAHSRAIPYGAVLYEPNGDAIAYTSPAPLQYVRAPIVVDHVAGGSALLSKGPPIGTRVVTVGADELLGTEQGVQGEG